MTELRADAPHYHKQPHTQDPSQEIPDENVPLAQGHSEEEAAEVKQAADEFRETVEAEVEQREQAQAKGEPEPGAVRTPDQIAKQDEAKDKKAKESDKKASAKKE